MLKEDSFAKGMWFNFFFFFFSAVGSFYGGVNFQDNFEFQYYGNLNT